MDKEIGSRIRELRLQQNITQTQIYNDCGISSGNLSSIENGKSLPSSAALKTLCKYLHCSADYILFGDAPAPGKQENVEKPEGTDIMYVNEEEAKFLDSYRRLSENDREEIRLLMSLKISRLLPPPAELST